jgi:tight adherence protein B
MPVILIFAVVFLAVFTLMLGVSMAAASAPKTDTPRLRRTTLAEGRAPRLARVARDFENLVTASGAGVAPAEFVIGMAAAAAGVMIGANLIAGAGPLACLAGGVVLGGVLPVVTLMAMRRRRRARLVSQLPEALDTLVRSLRVGHPVPAGIEMIATEMPDPIGSEFRWVFASMSYGLDLREALELMSERLRVPEVRYTVAAIRIQFATGGDLAEILASLARVMRERLRLAMKVRALTAETRVSGTIMSIMPFTVVGGISCLRPDFYQAVPESPALQAIMAGAAVLLVAGVLLIRHIVNIRM